MPIRIFPDGSVETDTVEEAYEYQKLLKNKYVITEKREKSTQIDFSQIHDEKFHSFMQSLTQLQIDVLLMISQHPEGITSLKMAEDTNRLRNTITGAIGPGLKKNIPKCGYGLEEIIIYKHFSENSLFYLPGPILLENKDDLLKCTEEML